MADFKPLNISQGGTGASNASDARNNLGAENVANKVTDFTVVDNITYPTTQAIVDYITSGVGTYTSWALRTNSIFRTNIEDGDILDIIAGTNITIDYAAGGQVTINSTADVEINVDTELDENSGNPVANSTLTPIINQILEEIAVPPTYTQPTVGLTNATQTVEKGTDLPSITLNITFNQNDAGLANGYSLERNGVEISTSQNNTESETNITSTIQYQGFVSYDQGDCEDNNLGIEDCNGRIQAGTKSSTTRTITPIVPIFYGVSSSQPTANQTLIDNGIKNIISSSGDISITFGASGEYLWFAIPDSSPERTSWYVNALNNGSIGAPTDLFPTSTVISITSPDGLWTEDFKIYVSNYATSTSSSMELRD